MLTSSPVLPPPLLSHKPHLPASRPVSVPWPLGTRSLHLPVYSSLSSKAWLKPCVRSSPQSFPHSPWFCPPPRARDRVLPGCHHGADARPAHHSPLTLGADTAHALGPCRLPGLASRNSPPAGEAGRQGRESHMAAHPISTANFQAGVPGPLPEETPLSLGAVTARAATRLAGAALGGGGRRTMMNKRVLSTTSFNVPSPQISSPLAWAGCFPTTGTVGAQVWFLLLLAPGRLCVPTVKWGDTLASDASHGHEDGMLLPLGTGGCSVNGSPPFGTSPKFQAGIAGTRPYGKTSALKTRCQPWLCHWLLCNLRPVTCFP